MTQNNVFTDLTQTKNLNKKGGIKGLQDLTDLLEQFVSEYNTEWKSTKKTRTYIKWPWSVLSNEDYKT